MTSSVARGGLIPTALLAQALGVRDILTAAVMWEDPLPEPVFLQFPQDPLLWGKRVLVVDDVWDSRRTAFYAEETGAWMVYPWAPEAWP